MTTNPIPLAETPVQALLAKYQSDPTFKAAFDAAGPTAAAVQVAAQYGLHVSLAMANCYHDVRCRQSCQTSHAASAI